MTRSLRILYIALFLGILLVLGIWSLRSFSTFSTSAETTVLNGKWTKAAETHYDDEFPIKRTGTNLWAALDFKLFNEGRPGVVLGKDQWLYTDEEFDAVANGEQNEADNPAIIQGVRDALEKQGTKLVTAIVPAKTRLYPEHIGNTKPASLHADLYQQFHAGWPRPGSLPRTCWRRCKLPSNRASFPAHRHALDANGCRSRRAATERRDCPENATGRRT